MKITATCVQDRPEVWFKGTKEERAVRILTMLDTDTDEPMPNTFDYRPSREELAEHGQGALMGKSLTVGVRAITPAKGGRLVMMGRIMAINGKAPENKPAK